MIMETRTDKGSAHTPGTAAQAEVCLQCALAQTSELKVLKHALAENHGHVLVGSQMGKKQPLRVSFGRRVDRCQCRADRSEFR